MTLRVATMAPVMRATCPAVGRATHAALLTSDGVRQASVVPRMDEV